YIFETACQWAGLDGSGVGDEWSNDYNERGCLLARLGGTETAIRSNSKPSPLDKAAGF
ncbi:hypothetical protein ACJX0J_027037, partial [Zea mays]